MADIIKGQPVANQIRDELIPEVQRLTAAGHPPRLAVLLVGEDPGSVWYAENKVKVGAKIGVEVALERMSADTAEAAVLGHIAGLNADPSVHGILVELPLPKHLDKARVMNAIDPSKDVDGVTAVNRGYVLGGQEDRALVPATPLACIELIERSGVSLRGKRVTLVGRGDTVGRPLALLLIKRDATVTVCHTKTVDLASECRRAEVLVAAAGSAKLVKKGMVAPGAVVIDAGVNETPEGFVGDVDFEAVKDDARAITPVPGGVGSLTTTIIMANTIKALKRRLA
jgi:methylenetetrahydrofolate dehydrogenase (NADP+) / methenyltetrahydrofolate cyclohydrolase